MIGRWLAWVGGAQEDVLREAPGDRAKYTTLGGVLLGTAFLAAASAVFGLQNTVKLDVASAVVVGVVWGLLILTLDRQLIATMTRQNSWRHNLVAALPRLALAILLGAVIAEPLVLRIFQPEIDAQLGRQQTEAIAAINADITNNPRFATITQLEEDVTALKDVQRDPEVTRLRTELDAERQKATNLNKEIGCEVVATTECAARDLGKGPRYEENTRNFDLAQRRVAALEPQLEEATDVAKKRIADGLGDPATELGRKNDELVKLTAERAELQANREETAAADTGLSARIQAMARLDAENSAVALAHWALFALFAVIEILPVVAKLLSLGSSLTLYEKLAARREQATLETGDSTVAQDREITDIRGDVRLQLERDRAQAQIDAGKQANEVLVAKQQEIATQAIEVWGKVATARSEKELAQWYAHHTAAARSAWDEPERQAHRDQEPIYRSDGDPRRRRPVEPAIPYADYQAGQTGGNGHPQAAPVQAPVDPWPTEPGRV